LAVFDLDLLLGGDDDLEDLVLDTHRLDAVLEVGFHFVLITGVRVDHVPLPVFASSAVAAVGDAHLIDHLV
jgi:hypothetical protein